MKNLKKFIQEEVQKLHQITLLENKKNQIERKLKLLSESDDVKAMYKKAGMEPPHPGKGIHTKKFHKCVTSVGDEGGKNPYAICMSSLGKEKSVKASHRTDESVEVEDKRENLEYFLSLNNDDIYWKWINEEITDSEAIMIMDEIYGIKYNPSINYKLEA